MPSCCPLGCPCPATGPELRGWWGAAASCLLVPTLSRGPWGPITERQLEEGKLWNPSFTGFSLVTLVKSLSLADLLSLDIKWN